MSSQKTLALALCLAMTGCANHGADGSKQAGMNWWPFGADKVADQDVKAAVTEKVAQADAKSEQGSRWWWPFGQTGQKAQAAAAVVPKIDHKATQAWLDQYEPKLREATQGTKFEVERRENVLVVTIPVDSSYNPDRPNMLLPVTLGPITRVAKLVETDPKTAVLVLGHADSSGAAALNQKLSMERAASVTAIFRLSGLQRDRLSLKGMGAEMPRAANDSVEGRALNRRVEMLLTPQDTMLALMARYQRAVPATPAAPMVAVQDTKAPVAAAPAKPVSKAPVKTAAKKPAAKGAAQKTAAAKKAPVKAAAKKTPAAKSTVSDKKVAANTKTN